MEKMKNRRQFLKTSALGATAACLGSRSILRGEGAKSRVVRIEDSRMLNPGGGFNEEAVKPVIEEVLTGLTGTGSAREAWTRIFPELGKDDVVGFKVNCINRHLSSHPEVVLPLARSLVDSLEMNPNNVIIWDRTARELERAGYQLNSSSEDIRVMGTREDAGYDDERLIEVNQGETVRPSLILSRMCTYLVNVPVLKDHERSGVTVSMKNHYGSIDNPRICHPGNCDPYIANINRDPLVRDKTRLIFLDAVQGIYDGGPMGTPQWNQHELMAAFDPVAIDYVCLNIIEKMRHEKGLPYIASMAQFIRTGNELGLGTNDINQIDLVTRKRA